MWLTPHIIAGAASNIVPAAPKTRRPATNPNAIAADPIVGRRAGTAKTARRGAGQKNGRARPALTHTIGGSCFLQPTPSRFIPPQVATPQDQITGLRSSLYRFASIRCAAFLAAIWAWLNPPKQEAQTRQPECDRSQCIPEQHQERHEELHQQPPPTPGGSPFLHPEWSRFITGKTATPPKPFSRFFDMPASVPPPPESRPPDTPAPVSKFLPPAASVTPPPEDDDPPPTPPTIPPTQRKLHALWKAKNFRKPLTP